MPGERLKIAVGNIAYPWLHLTSGKEIRRNGGFSA